MFYWNNTGLFLPDTFHAVCSRRRLPWSIRAFPHLITKKLEKTRCGRQSLLKKQFARGLRIEPTLRTGFSVFFTENHCDTQLWARAAHWLQCLGRLSLPPSKVSNMYQPYGWVITPMAMGECSAYSSLQAESKVKFVAWPTSWRPPDSDADFHSEDPSKLSHMALCHSW